MKTTNSKVWEFWSVSLLSSDVQQEIAGFAVFGLKDTFNGLIWC